MKRLLASLLLICGSAFSQPATQTPSISWVINDPYPVGVGIPVTGTINSVTPGANCSYSIGTPTGTVWIRVIGSSLISGGTPLSIGDHSITSCAVIRANGVDYTITPVVSVLRKAAITITNNAGVADASLSNCSGSTTGRVPIVANCQDPDERPGGSFTMPPAGSTYTDEYGTEVTVLHASDNDGTNNGDIHYAGINAYNYDETLVYLEGYGIVDAVTGDKIYNEPTSNGANGNMWFSQTPGHYDELVNIDESAGKVYIRTIPVPCNTPPCNVNAATEVYSVASLGRTQFSKGGTTSGALDGWIAGRAVSADNTEIDLVALDIYASPIVPIVLTNLQNAPYNTDNVESDFIMIAKDFDPDSKRRLYVPGDGGVGLVFSFTPGDTAFTFEEHSPPRADEAANLGLRPTCTPGVEGVGSCISAFHGDLFVSEGVNYIAVQGSDATVPGFSDMGMSFSLRSFANHLGAVGEEIGGGRQHFGTWLSYGGCAYFTAMCATTKVIARAGTLIHATNIACSGGICTVDTDVNHGYVAGNIVTIGYNNVNGISKDNAAIASIVDANTFTYAQSGTASSTYPSDITLWAAAMDIISGTCAVGTCTATVALQTPAMLGHGYGVGSSVLIGANTVGITPGTVVTVASVPSGSIFTWSSAATGTLTGSYAVMNVTQNTLNGGEITVIRKFGTHGTQIHRVASLKGPFYRYEDEQKPTISPHGTYIAWTTSNGIPGMRYTLSALVGLGSPHTAAQFTGTDDGVTVTPNGTSATFTVIYPPGESSCSVEVSPYEDLTNSQTLTFNSPTTTQDAMMLALDDPYVWRARCGDIATAAGGFVATVGGSPSPTPTRKFGAGIRRGAGIRN